MFDEILEMAKNAERQRILMAFLAAIQSPDFRELRVAILFGDGANLEVHAKPLADMNEQDVCLALLGDVAICQKKNNLTIFEEQLAKNTQVDLAYLAASAVRFTLDAMEKITNGNISCISICATSSSKSVELIFDSLNCEDLKRECLYSIPFFDCLFIENNN